MDFQNLLNKKSEKEKKPKQLKAKDIFKTTKKQLDVIDKKLKKKK